jgi:hypothetical protein
MTETTERRGNGGDVETGENQQQVFTCFHIPLGIRQTPPDSHIPTAPATVALPKTQKTKTRKESAAARPPLPDLFQNHVVLETLLHFRIIRRLEYALPAAHLVGDPPDTVYRPKQFMVGSRELDTTKVGFKSGLNDYKGFLFDTTLPANSNAGHEYGTRAMSDPGRWDLVEYLKSL